MDTHSWIISTPQSGTASRIRYAVYALAAGGSSLTCSAGIVELLPLWLAPNLITLIGVSALVVAYVVTLFYLPGLAGTVVAATSIVADPCQVERSHPAFSIIPAAGSGPWWLYYLNGFSVFWYLHLDCLDGKQARRTKSSSPLGQLFDHGMPVCLYSNEVADALQ